MAMLIEIVLYK